MSFGHAFLAGVFPPLPTWLTRGAGVPAGSDWYVDTAGALRSNGARDVFIGGNLEVTGVTTLLGGETFTGLGTVNSAAGAGAAGVLGPEEIQFETTQAATAGATIRNPGYIDWEARVWDGAASVAAAFGRFGAVVDTLAAGAISDYRLVWTNTAGTIQWSVNQNGVSNQLGGVAIGGITMFESDRDLAINLVPNADNAVDLGTASRRAASVVSVRFDVYAAAGAANPVGRLGQSGLQLGSGGAAAMDWALTRFSVDVVELATGDSLYSVGAATLGHRNASGDATPRWDATGTAMTFYPVGVAAGNTYEVRFRELAASGANYVGFKGGDLLAANVIWTLPTADATVAGAALTSNAAGVLSWTSAAAALANERYVIIGPASGPLTDERVLTGTANQIVVTDGGAGAAVTHSTPRPTTPARRQPSPT